MRGCIHVCRCLSACPSICVSLFSIVCGFFCVFFFFSLSCFDCDSDCRRNELVASNRVLIVVTCVFRELVACCQRLGIHALTSHSQLQFGTGHFLCYQVWNRNQTERERERERERDRDRDRDRDRQTDRQTDRQRASYLFVSRCFEPSQPQRIT